MYGHKTATVDDPHVEALSLITSGSLIPRDAIKEVGPMREDFLLTMLTLSGVIVPVVRDINCLVRRGRCSISAWVMRGCQSGSLDGATKALMAQFEYITGCVISLRFATLNSLIHAGKFAMRCIGLKCV